MGDPVNHPKHYNTGEIETIDFVDQTCRHYPGEEAFSIGNALRYLARGPHKNNKIEDVRKAIWYLEHAAELMEEKQRARWDHLQTEDPDPTPDVTADYDPPPTPPIATRGKKKGRRK
jgi:Protein of unknwon function (DUF3310)